MNWMGFGVRVLLAFVAAMGAARAAAGTWEASLFAAMAAGLTTAEAYLREPTRAGNSS